MEDKNLMTNQITNDENEINLFQLGKVIFHRWKLLSIITAATTLVGTLGITFLYTRNAAKYSLEFHYSVPSMNNENTKLINETSFSYLDLVSKTVLNSIVESNDSYSSFNLENLVKDIEITRENKNEDTKSELYDYYYTITIPEKHFNNDDIAFSFIKDLASYPVDQTNSILASINYKTSLKNYDNAITYTEQISYLQKEYDVLDTAYTDSGVLQFRS